MTDTMSVSPLSDIKAFKAAWNSTLKETSDTIHTASGFNPYSEEGGTVGAIAGDDFVVIGGDTRMSLNAFSIMTRETLKVHKLSDSVYMASAGFTGDINQLVKVLRTKIRIYKFNFHEELGVECASEMLSRTLYYKRFFPYYTANILGGIDREGKGAVYTYDPVGTIERVPYSIQGAATSMIEPFFDNQIGNKTQPKEGAVPLTKARATTLLKDAFRSAAERDTSTGDSLRIFTLTKGEPVKEEVIMLRSD